MVTSRFVSLGYLPHVYLVFYPMVTIIPVSLEGHSPGHRTPYTHDDCDSIGRTYKLIRKY